MLWSHRILMASGDIDVVSVEGQGFAEACERVGARLGLPIPVQRVGVFDAPYSYEARLEQAPGLHFKNIEVMLPERHDWALMKAARGAESDLDHVEQVHQLGAFDLATLVERFGEMQFVGPPRRLRQNFLALIERLFGTAAAEQADRALPEPRG